MIFKKQLPHNIRIYYISVPHVIHNDRKYDHTYDNDITDDN